MTHVSYLIAGWGSVFIGCAVYVWSVLSRGRKLSAHVPADKARWMTAKDADRIGES